MRNECKVLVRIKKGYGWQLEEHPKIAGAVSLLGVVVGIKAAAAVGREAGASLLCGGMAHLSSAWWPLGQDKRLAAQWDCAREEITSHRAPKVIYIYIYFFFFFPPPHWS